MSLRFVSPYTAFRLRVIAEDGVQLPNGLFNTTRPSFFAQFRGGDFTDYEKALAYERFGQIMRSGSRMEADMVTPASTDWRIGTFDTATIPDPDLRAEVEQRMLKKLDEPGMAQFFALAEKPKVAKPWPKYDEIKSAKAIVDTVNALGLNREDVAAYERDNQNRKEVLEALGQVEDEGKIEVAA